MPAEEFGRGTGAGRATESEWAKSPDIVEAIISRLDDGAVAARCCAVSRQFRQAASNDALWLKLVKRRWHVKNVRGNASWKTLYAQWSISRRQPTSSFSGDNFPAFAVSSSKSSSRTQKFERYISKRFDSGAETAGLRLWALVMHTQDCSIPVCPRTAQPLLHLNIVLQNFDRRRVTFNAGDIRLRLKNGNTLKPLSYNEEDESGHDAKIIACTHKNQVKEYPEGKSKHVSASLGHWDFAVIGDLRFAMPIGTAFEPEALEACEQLTLGLTRGGEEGADCGVVRATFDESKIWRHYSELPGRFFVFSQRPLDMTGL